MNAEKQRRTLRRVLEEIARYVLEHAQKLPFVQVANEAFFANLCVEVVAAYLELVVYSRKETSCKFRNVARFFVKREVGVFEFIVLVKLIDERDHLVGFGKDYLQILLLVLVAHQTVFYRFREALNYGDRGFQVVRQSCKHTLFVRFERKFLLLARVEKVHHFVETVVKVFKLFRAFVVQMLVLFFRRKRRHCVGQHRKRFLDVLVDVANVKHHNRRKQCENTKHDNHD